MKTQRYIILAKERPCTIAVTLEGNGKAHFFGKEKNGATKFFARKKEIRGLETITFPLPISPTELELYIKGDVKVRQVRLMGLRPPKIKLQKETFDFIQHVFDFCKNFNRVDTGIYTDKYGRFPIVLSAQILNRETKKPMNTPARISRATGQIEVSQEKFGKYTVPIQVFILFHERSHYELQTSNELECDLQALQWYLGFGFPQTEAIYANTKIFSGDNPEHVKRATQILDYVKHYNYEKGYYDNGFCGLCQ